MELLVRGMHSVADRIVDPAMVQADKARIDGGASKEDDNNSPLLEDEIKAGKRLPLDEKRNKPSDTLTTPKASSVFVKLSSPISFETVDTEDESELELDTPERKASTCMVSRRIRWSDESGENLTTVRVFQNNVEEASIRIVLLLLHPTRKSTFEFVHCEFQTDQRLLVSDVIDQIPSLATCPYFKKKKTRKFRSLVRDAPPHHELINILTVQDYGLRDGEIIVAVPKAAQPKESLARAHRLLQADDKFLRKAVKRARISGRALRTLRSSADWHKPRKTLKVAKKSADLSKVGDKPRKDDIQQGASCVVEPGTECIDAHATAMGANVSSTVEFDGENVYHHRENKETETIAEAKAHSVDSVLEMPIQENALSAESTDVETIPEVAKSVDRDCELGLKENDSADSIAGPVSHTSNSTSNNSVKQHESPDEDGDEDDDRFLSDKVMRKYDKTKAARLSVATEKNKQAAGEGLTDIKKPKKMPEEVLRAHEKAKAAVAAKNEKKDRRKKRRPKVEKLTRSDSAKESTIGLEKQTAGISADKAVTVEKNGSSIADEIVCDDTGVHAETGSHDFQPSVPDVWMNIHKEDGNFSCESTKTLQESNQSECEEGIMATSNFEEQPVDDEPVVLEDESRDIPEIDGDFEARPEAFEQVHADVWINVVEKHIDETSSEEVAASEGNYSNNGNDKKVFLHALQEPPALHVEVDMCQSPIARFSEDDVDDGHPIDDIGDFYLEGIIDEGEESPEDEDNSQEDEQGDDIEYGGEEYEDCAVLVVEGTEDIDYEGENFEDCPVVPKAKWCHLDSVDDIPDNLTFPIEI